MGNNTEVVDNKGLTKTRTKYESLPTTRQEWFNRAWEHFVVKGFPKCEEAYIGCLYRSDKVADSPNACALGVSIPDNLYDSFFDSCGCESTEKVLESLGVDKKEFEFLLELQGEHDYSEEQWKDKKPYFNLKERLTKFANKYDLEIPGEEEEES